MAREVEGIREVRPHRSAFVTWRKWQLDRPSYARRRWREEEVVPLEEPNNPFPVFYGLFSKPEPDGGKLDESKIA